MLMYEDMVRRLVGQLKDRDGGRPRGLYAFFHLFDGVEDEAELQCLDDDGSFLSRSSRYHEGKQAEYSAIVQFSILAQAAISAGIDAYIVYDICDYYLKRFAEARTVEEYRWILSDAGEYLTRYIEARTPETAEPVHISRCKNYIDTHLLTDFSLADAAASVGVTPAYLSALFREHEGITMKEYILRLRVAAAKELLKDPAHSIGCIASTLCFCSQSHFSYIFRKYEGMTPSAYRSAHME